MVRGNLRGPTLRGAIAFCCGVAFLVSVPMIMRTIVILRDFPKLFGYDQGVLGAVIGLESFRRDFDNPSSNLEGMIASIYDIGCFVGAIVAFVTADRLGRKGSINVGSWIMVVGTILQTSANEKIQMIISRIITGIGNGMNTVNAPIWQAESFKSHNRGASLKLFITNNILTSKGYAHHPECPHRLWSPPQHIHGSSQSASRTLIVWMAMAHCLPRCVRCPNYPDPTIPA